MYNTASQKPSPANQLNCSVQILHKIQWRKWWGTMEI